MWMDIEKERGYATQKWKFMFLFLSVTGYEHTLFMYTLCIRIIIEFYWGFTEVTDLDLIMY